MIENIIALARFARTRERLPVRRPHQPATVYRPGTGRRVLGPYSLMHAMRESTKPHGARVVEKAPPPSAFSDYSFGRRKSDRVAQ